MLALMLGPWLGAVALHAAFGRSVDVRNAAAMGLGLLFVFTGVGHFVQAQPMVQMLPPWVPERLLLVHASGILEFAIALGFFVPKLRRVSGLAAAAVLVVFFPLNIYAALHHIPMGGHAWGPVYLLIRAPLQALILGWVYWFTIRMALHSGLPRRSTPSLPAAPLHRSKPRLKSAP
nr:hypothetical protein [Acidovorax sp. SRB_24]